MKKRELYKELGMDEFYFGDSFIVDRDKSCFDIIKEIDHLCITEKRNPLGGKWNELNFGECSDLLLNAFNFDLAYKDFAVMPIEKAEFYRNFIVSKFDESDTVCFTNWFQNPWKNKNVVVWNPITDNTFDMAIVFADSTKIVFTYFIGED